MIFKHSRRETRKINADDAPLQYRHLLIPHANIYLTEGLFGTIISQEVPEKEFAIWQHHFFIDEPSKLIAYNETPVIAINYMLSGNPYIKLPGIREPLLSEGTYRMFFMPSIAQKVSILPGSHHFIHVAYDIPNLKHQIKGRYRLEKLLGYIILKGKYIRPYLSGDLDSKTRRAVVDILNPGEHHERIGQQAGRLILNYVSRHHTVKDDIGHIEKYIRTNLEKKITADILAKQYGKSRSDLFKAFSEQLQTSPYQYIQELRLKKGLDSLKCTDDSIAEIGLMVGYKNVAQFSKAFKGSFKCSPSSIRGAD